MLLNAGFTKDEIMKMLPKDPDPKEEPKPEPAKDPDPAPEPEQKEEPKPEPFNTQPFTDAIKSMEDAMQAMNAKMQRLALSMYEGPENKKESVQDLIIKVIDPAGIKKGE